MSFEVEGPLRTLWKKLEAVVGATYLKMYKYQHSGPVYAKIPYLFSSIKLNKVEKLDK